MKFLCKFEFEAESGPCKPKYIEADSPYEAVENYTWTGGCLNYLEYDLLYYIEVYYEGFLVGLFLSSPYEFLLEITEEDPRVINLYEKWLQPLPHKLKMVRRDKLPPAPSNQKEAKTQKQKTDFIGAAMRLLTGINHDRF